MHYLFVQYKPPFGQHIYNNRLIALFSPCLNGYTSCVFVPSDIAPQFPIQERPAHCLFAGVTGLHKRAYIVLLKEFLAVDQDEGGVFQNHSLALPTENSKTCHSCLLSYTESRSRQWLLV